MALVRSLPTNSLGFRATLEPPLFSLDFLFCSLEEAVAVVEVPLERDNDERATLRSIRRDVRKI